MKKHTKGYLIAIEGIDGSGKTTLNPFGQSVLQKSEITDIRHTATALLAALCFGAPVTFIADALPYHRFIL